ncbi:hypothetical protein BC940DRAFT_295108 [Gongronella butleri]|nr:hypothetical protein BC940DRAFT_295108 [Gongronella butleri]
MPTHSTSSDWSSSINTPSPLYFPEASPTPKLSSTPSKKPVSPVDWQQEMRPDELRDPTLSLNSPASTLARARHSLDGDLTRPELEAILDKLQQSTLSADTLTSSFHGDIGADDDDSIPDDADLLELLVHQAAEPATVVNSTTLAAQQRQREIQKVSDSQQLQQWLQRLPTALDDNDDGHPQEKDDSASSSSSSSPAPASSDLKRVSLVHVGKQWMTRVRRATSMHKRSSS